MVVTVRLDEKLEAVLTHISKTLHKCKSDVIRETISFYAQSIEADKKSRILKAVEKAKDLDKKEFKDFEGTTDDGL